MAKASPGRVAVAIAEGDPVIRESLRQLLERAPELKCVGVHASGVEALCSIPVTMPDVALVDLDLSGAGHIECVGRLRKLAPQTRLLMMATFEDGNRIFEALCAGASGCLLKTIAPADLVQTILLVHAGGSPMSVQTARKAAVFFQQARLSGRPASALTGPEEIIITLLAKGRPYQEISSELNLTMSAVWQRLRGVCEKLHHSSACHMK